jgi:hypothetical protein
MPKFNHMVVVAFEVISNDFYGDDLTPAMLKEAMIKRIDSLDNSNGWSEAIDITDTFMEEDSP